jgi:hypothetical protein
MLSPLLGKRDLWAEFNLDYTAIVSKLMSPYVTIVHIHNYLKKIYLLLCKFNSLMWLELFIAFSICVLY